MLYRGYKGKEELLNTDDVKKPAMFVRYINKILLNGRRELASMMDGGVYSKK